MRSHLQAVFKGSVGDDMGYFERQEGLTDSHLGRPSESWPRPMTRGQGGAMTQIVRRLSCRHTTGFLKNRCEKVFLRLFYALKKSMHGL